MNHQLSALANVLRRSVEPTVGNSRSRLVAGAAAFGQEQTQGWLATTLRFFLGKEVPELRFHT